MAGKKKIAGRKVTKKTAKKITKKKVIKKRGIRKKPPVGNRIKKGDPRAGRKPGSRNKKTLQKEESERVRTMFGIVLSRNRRPSNVKRLERGIDEVYKMAEQGDLPSIQLCLNMQFNLSEELAIRLATAQLDIFKELTDRIETLTFAEAMRWGLEHSCEFTDSPKTVELFEYRMKEILNQIVQRDTLFIDKIRATLERDRVELIRQNTVTDAQVFGIVKVFSEAMGEVLAGSVHLEEMVAVIQKQLEEKYPRQALAFALESPLQITDGKENERNS